MMNNERCSCHDFFPEEVLEEEKHFSSKRSARGRRHFSEEVLEEEKHTSLKKCSRKRALL